jgi:uncharacterized protein (TIGR02058 family)
MQRFFLEIGMGNDLHGQDNTKAAARAIEDAILHSSIPMFETHGISHDAMQMRVSVGVQYPDTVDCEALKTGLPHGQVFVTAVHGGLNDVNSDTGNVAIIANAAAEVFLPFDVVRGAS